VFLAFNRFRAEAVFPKTKNERRKSDTLCMPQRAELCASCRCRPKIIAQPEIIALAAPATASPFRLRVWEWRGDGGGPGQAGMLTTKRTTQISWRRRPIGRIVRLTLAASTHTVNA
jgi:hypothetical protein